MAKLKTTLSGFDWDRQNDKLETTPKSIDVGQPFSDLSKPSSGMPITIEAFLMMFKKFIDRSPAPGDPLHNIYAFTINKASLLRILSQEECESIGFYFVLTNNENDISLAIAGKKSGGELIQQDSIHSMAIEIDAIEINKPAKITPVTFDKTPVLDEKVGVSKLPTSGIQKLGDLIKENKEKDATYGLTNILTIL